MKFKIIFLLLLTFVLQDTLICKNENYLLDKISYYENYFDKIEVKEKDGRKLVSLYLINRKDSAFFMQIFFASLDIAVSIYQYDSVPFTIHYIVRPSIDSDYNLTSFWYTKKKLNAYINAISDIEFEKSKVLFMNEKWETYNSLRYFFEFLKEENDSYYINSPPFDYFIFYSLLSASDNFKEIETLYGITKEYINQPIIDMYITRKFLYLICKYKAGCKQDVIDHNKYLLEFTKKILLLSGMTEPEIQSIDMKDISPGLESENYKSFQEIMDYNTTD